MARGRTACAWLRRSGEAGDLGPSLKGLGPGGSILAGWNVVAAEVEEVVIPSWADKKRCAWPADLKRFICRSLCRVGWCEFSALLFSPLCFLCSTEGITSRLAAP